MPFKKGYIGQPKYADLISGYDQCGRMLKALEKSLTS
jgi:hypothetical protein